MKKKNENLLVTREYLKHHTIKQKKCKIMNMQRQLNIRKKENFSETAAGTWMCYL